jgi:hypothetical protein
MAIVRLLLPLELPDAEELRNQIDQALVVGMCDCGCPTVDITVASLAPPSTVYVGRAPLPYEGVVLGDLGGGIILFAQGGYLSSFEYYSSDEQVPHDWPALDRIKIEGPFER